MEETVLCQKLQRDQTGIFKSNYMYLGSIYSVILQILQSKVISE